MPLIASAIPGRIRLKFSGQNAGTQLETLAESCRQRHEITSIRVNPQARSLLINYDPGSCSLAAMLTWLTPQTPPIVEAAAPQQSKPLKRPRPLKLRVNRAAKIGALSSLTASMVWAATGNKRLHIASGAVFLGFLAIHLAVYRRNLLR